MGTENVRSVKSRIWRRIAVKTAVCALWAAGMLYVALYEGREVAQVTYWSMLFAIVAMWIVSMVRDVRLLRDEELLRKAAIEQSDERNVLISYKACRLAVTAMACLLPFVMFALAYAGRHDLVEALGFAVCAFLVVYMASWFYVSRKC